MSVPVGVALAVALLACAFDVKTRRVPNELTFGAALLAMSLHSAVEGPGGFGMAVAGWFTGFALFLPFYLLRGLGAGDVKLLAALGAWLGPVMAVWIALWCSVAGGVLAIVVALAHGHLRRVTNNLWLLLAHWRVAGVGPVSSISLDSDSDAPRLAYAVPIAVGLVVALWLQ